MGARAATPCDRSLSGGAAPSTYQGWVCFSLREKSPWLECTPAGQSAYCLVTMGVCPSPFPLNCYGSACSFESHAVWHLLALRRGVLSMPELLRRLALAVRCGAFAPAVRCLSSGSSREKMAGLPAAHVPRQLSCSASGVKCMGIHIFSRAICFVSRLRCVGSRVFQPVLESLGRCRLFFLGTYLYRSKLP